MDKRKVIFEYNDTIEAYKVGDEDNLSSVLKRLENKLNEVRQKLGSGNYFNVGFFGGAFYKEPEYKRIIPFSSKDKNIDEFSPSNYMLALHEKNFFKKLKKEIPKYLESFQNIDISISVLADKIR